MGAAEQIDRSALDQYVAAVRRGSRLVAERHPPGVTAVAVVDPGRARWYRLHATNASQRLDGGAYPEAARAGLQDSAPRAALVALHARTRPVQPDSWEHPTLAQIWLRWADHVVPRDDLALFTIGTMPRDERWASALEALADAVIAATGAAGTASSRHVAAALPGLPIRSTCSTGRVLIRWDARVVELLVCDPPTVDPEQARIGLARRFVHCHGPVGRSHLSRWAWVARDDAVATWDALRAELVPVLVGTSPRWMLASDVDALVTSERPVGVRLLSAGDPALHVVDEEEHMPRVPVRPELGVTNRLVNSLSGRVLLDGDIVGAWGRLRGDVTVVPWVELVSDAVAAIEQEAASMADALGYAPRLRWLDRAT